MSTQGVIGLLGIGTSGNELKQPKGRLLKAENCVIPSRDCIEPRRGQPTQSGSDGVTQVYFDGAAADTNQNRAKALFQWGSHLIISAKGGSTYRMFARQNFLQGSEALVSIGNYAPPEPTLLRMKFAELGESLFWTTDVGLYVLDAITGTARKAGLRAPPIYLADGVSQYTGLTAAPNAVGTWYAKNQTVAGRATWGRKDANGRIIESGPSGRVVVQNPNDVSVAIGGLVRNANVVTATVAAHKFRVGDRLNLTLAGADIGNFNATDNVVTSVTSTTIVWSQTAANYTNVAVATITSGSKNIQWTVGLLAEMVAGDFVRVYRTDEAAGEAIDPGDECFLAYERQLSSTDISNGYVAITDTTPASFLGGSLDTNANTGEGAVDGVNERPPLMRDLCRWDDRLWGLQTTDRHRLTLRLLGSGSPNGLQSGDLVAINTRVFEAAVNFGLYTQYLPTENVDRTTYDMGTYMTGSLVGINARQTHDGETGLGQVLFEQTELASTMADGSSGTIGAIYAATSRASAWGNALAATKPITAASTSRAGSTVTVRCTAHGFAQGQIIMLARAVSSATDANFPLGLKTVASVVDANNFTYTEAGAAATLSGTYYAYATTFKSSANEKVLRCSKQGVPEAWPLSHAPSGFPDRADGYRVMPLASGDGLLVALKDAGLYTVTGKYPYFVRPLTKSTSLVAPDSLVEHADRLHALTTQGAAAISDSGVEILDGGAVEDELRERLYDLSIVASAELASVFGVSYESDRQYQLWLPTTSNTATRGYIFHSLVREWTKWPETRTCGLVFKGGVLGERLVLGDASLNRLRVEKKVYGASRYLNYHDGVITLAGLAADATDNGNGTWALVLLAAPSGVAAGDVAFNITANGYALVTAVGGVNVTVAGSASGWVSSDDIYFLKRFDVSAQFIPDTRGAPGVESQFRELQLHFGEWLVRTLTFAFLNERSTTSAPLTLTDSDYLSGTRRTGLTTQRMSAPNDTNRGATLTVQFTLGEALSYFKLLGYSLTGEDTSEKTGR